MWFFGDDDDDEDEGDDGNEDDDDNNDADDELLTIGLTTKRKVNFCMIHRTYRRKELHLQSNLCDKYSRRSLWCWYS